jgi:phytoene dehydrogenase-like protein
LLPAKYAPERLWKTERSSSALIFYWGINRKFPQLELHNILFSEDYRDEFDHIFKRKEICGDPTVYIFISSKVVKEDAPGDGENWFVMINTPVNEGQDWDEQVRSARQTIIRKINRNLNTDIEKFIEHEHVVNPVTIERNTGSAQGAIYGTSSNNPFAAFLRHPNRRKAIRGLYFAGGSVHPGGGIPLCLASAAIVAETIMKDEK